MLAKETKKIEKLMETARKNMAINFKKHDDKGKHENLLLAHYHRGKMNAFSKVLQLLK